MNDTFIKKVRASAVAAMKFDENNITNRIANLEINTPNLLIQKGRTISYTKAKSIKGMRL
jgi:hypothetical protein